MTGPPAQSPWKWLLARAWPATWELLALSFFVNAIALALPVFVLQVYDRVVGQAGLTTLQGLAIGIVLAILFDLLLRQTRSNLVQRTALRIDIDLGVRLFEKLNRIPLQQLEARPGAFWQGLFRDAELLRNTVAGPPAILLVDLPFALLFLGLVYIIAEPLIWVLALAILAFVLVALRSGAVIRRRGTGEREAAIDRDGVIGDFIANRTTIKALALDNAVRPSWERQHAAAIERSMLRGRSGDTYANLGTALSMLTTVALTTVGALAIIDQRLSIGALVATNMLAGRIVGPFLQLVMTWRIFVHAGEAARRLGEILSLAEEQSEPGLDVPRPRGELLVDKVTFAYRDDREPVLRQLGLRLPAGGINAVVGRNGSGKSTLLKVMQGLYQPQSGRILLDGADIAQFTREQLARWIGYLPQETVLLATSIRDNIARGRDGITDQDVLRAAERADAHAFIADLPDGYATIVGENGRELSGGRRQRIALARTLLGDPPILLLDEPSAGLDREAEEKLRDTLVELSNDHTILMVTHNPTLLSACQNVIVIDRGRAAVGRPNAEKAE